MLILREHAAPRPAVADRLLPTQILNIFSTKELLLVCLDGFDLLCRHMGHWPLEESCLIHSMMQCLKVSASLNLPFVMLQAGTDHVKVVTTLAGHLMDVAIISTISLLGSCSGHGIHE